MNANTKTTENAPRIIEDRFIQHRGTTSGIVITREQTVDFEGVRTVVRHWHDLNTGRLHHMDSVNAR
jgi:hypothetical protein